METAISAAVVRIVEMMKQRLRRPGERHSRFADRVLKHFKLNIGTFRFPGQKNPGQSLQEHRLSQTIEILVSLKARSIQERTHFDVVDSDRLQKY